MSAFTPAHRGGTGPPMVCLHGFLDTWRVWELVLPMLERRHDVLAPTLPGHAGGPPAGPGVSAERVADVLEALMDEAGFPIAHLVGNSLGGYLALLLAARGRAASVVALAPAGGWAPDDPSWRELLRGQVVLHEQQRLLAPRAVELLATPEGRRRATRRITERSDHLPAELLAHQMLGGARCEAESLVAAALRDGYALDAERITCPVRIVWGTEDRLLPWPTAAARYRTAWLPHADWVVLDGVGHCPQLDVPLETAELITGFTAP